MAELGARPKYNREVKIIGTKALLISCGSDSFINTTTLVVFFAYPLCH